MRESIALDNSVGPTSEKDTSDESYTFSSDRAEPVLSALDECEPYWDELEQTYWTGECATQQEVDDAIAILIATDEEATELDQEVSGVYENFNEFCDEEYPYCEEDQERGDEAAPLESMETYFARACYANGIGYAIALGAFGLRLQALSVVATASTAGVAAPVGAVMSAIGWATLAAGAIVGTGLALHNCVNNYLY